jgi:hypothetical protein
MMVRERVFDQPQPGMTQMIEKSSGITDAGHGMDGRAAKAGQCRGDAGIDQVHRRIAAQAHQIFVAPGCAVADDEIHLTQPGGRFAQWASRQAGAVAQPAQAIHDRTFDIAF